LYLLGLVGIGNGDESITNGVGGALALLAMQQPKRLFIKDDVLTS
jgi:hypothetical protein